MVRKEFVLTEEELQALYNACRPVPYMVAAGTPPLSPQERANAAWQGLAKKYGFVWDTVRPVPGKGHKYFTAEVVS